MCWCVWLSECGCVFRVVYCMIMYVVVFCWCCCCVARGGVCVFCLFDLSSDVLVCFVCGVVRDVV